jgi:hypothetical protein
MWVFHKNQLFNLKHAVDVQLDGNLIRIGYVHGASFTLHFETDAEAQRMFRVLMMRLDRLDGVLIAEEGPNAR